MSNISYLIIIFLIYLENAFVFGITVRKYVYQKDMSEHCRRRVVPSVFLGKHVIDAHSQVLDFSKMELPYSCFISVRAESGNNIVLVVQLLSEENLVRACSEGSSQLLVYEMGETFGGYWGPLPDSVVKQRPPPAKSELYTRKTNRGPHPDKLKTIKLQTSNTVVETRPTTEGPKEVAEEGDFIRVEVPIVEVVGSEVDGPAGQAQEAFDSDEVFDLLYDVTPRRRGQYSTTILPVVQFAIRQQDGRRGEQPRFDIEYEAPMYTPDERLMFSRDGVKTTKKRKSSANPYVNRLLNFKSATTQLRPVKQTLYFKEYYTKSQGITSSFLINKTPSSTETGFTYLTRPHIENWENIEKNIKKLNESTVDKYPTEKKNTKNIIEAVANMKHNYSAYLVPDWISLIDDQSKSNIINETQIFKAFTRKPLPILNYASKYIHQFRRATVHPKLLIKEVITTNRSSIKELNRTDIVVSTGTKGLKDNDNNIVVNITTESTVLQNHSEAEAQFTSSARLKVTTNFTIYDISTSTQSVEVEVTNYTEKSTLLTGSMVGHESWENVVQAAPVMAVLLNKSNKSSKLVHSTATDKMTEEITTTSRKKVIRKKRKIEAIPIQNARPHNMTTKASVATTTAASFRFSDMQEFAQLVELHDDELHERVALRYLRQYVGPSLFNLCSNGEPKAKHVFLFNSSRVIIAINNFSLDRMTVMLTPARALMGGAARCPQGNLECQVYGTRICIDTINACDGVPNCGAYDIYDEDRLMCGGAGGLQHNVYLAAVTFLALLLTLMYTVHYWLKRCVPKVSEAFFIYTNGTENVLYLETIMRSPHDMDDSMLKFYHGHLPDENYLYPDVTEQSKQNVIRRMLTACFNFCKCKRKKKLHGDMDTEDDFCNNFNEPRKIYSFAELELNKMLYQTDRIDTAVQTGDSLEMSRINVLQIQDSIEDKRLSSQSLLLRRPEKVSASGSTLDSDLQKHVDELSMLKIFKDVKSEPLPSTSREVPTKLHKRRRGIIEEEELRTHVYEQQPFQKQPTKHIQRKTNENNYDAPAEPPESSKQTVKRLRFEEETIAIPCNDDGDEDGSQQTSNIELEDRKKKDHDSHKGESHLSSGTGRDFRFWKSKKSKRKTIAPFEKHGRMY